MKWIWISFFSVIILLSAMFTAGFQFIEVNGPQETAQAAPVAAQ